MSLDKGIKHKKEHRKPYYGAKAVDPACRNHGSDDWSRDNRLIQSNREKERAEAKLREQKDDTE